MKQATKTAAIDVLVDRRPQSIELFMRFPARNTETIFGITPDALAASDGRVYFGALRETGTFDFGDAMIAGTRLSLGGEEQPLEAMSVMVHPADNALPFETPLDGNIAMAVCTVPDPVVPPALTDLVLYTGFISYPATGAGEIKLSMPNTVPLELAVSVFEDGRLVQRHSVDADKNSDILIVAEGALAEENWLGRLQRLFQ
ncbi:hypothetical protein [Shimia ponticola]|uniref:hypothetical protein n=1 Tax=Shimia ponticola TaxID=2582893 RepID=UPI0011BDF09B|nr:hypothetical protein [Shimia ponticola]